MARLDNIARRAQKRGSGPELPTWWSLAAGVLGVVIAVAVLYKLGSDTTSDATTADPGPDTVFVPLNSTSIPETTSGSLPPSTTNTATSSTQPISDQVEIPTLSGALASLPGSLVKQINERALSDAMSSDASILSTVLRSEDVTGYYLDVTVDTDSTNGNNEVVFYYSAAGSTQDGWRITRVK